MNYRSLGNGINGAVECIDTLANILALTLGTSVTQTTVPVRSKARPTDVAGCTLEMGADGLWTGNLGTLTQAQANAIQWVNLDVSRCVATADGIKNRYGTAAVGDSITASTGHGGWYDMACIISNQAILRRANLSMYGYSLKDMRANMLSAIYRGVSEIFIMGGTNRSPLTASGTDYISGAANDMKYLVQLGLLFGIKISIFGIPPADAAGVTNYRQYTEDCNCCFQAIATTYNVSYHYIWEHVVDPATGGCLTSMFSSDLVHLTPTAQLLAAQKLISLRGGLDNPGISEYLPSIQRQQLGGVWTNPLHISQLTSGVLAAEWSASGAGTGFSTTVTAATDSFGNSQNIVAAAIAQEKGIFRVIPNASRGKKYVIVAKISIPALSADAFVRFGIQYLDSVYASISNEYALYGVPKAGIAGTLYMETTIPANADLSKSRFAVLISTGQTATASISRHQMYDVANLVSPNNI